MLAAIIALLGRHGNDRRSVHIAGPAHYLLGRLVRRVGLAPIGKRRLITAHTQGGSRAAARPELIGFIEGRRPGHSYEHSLICTMCGCDRHVILSDGVAYCTRRSASNAWTLVAGSS